MKRTLLRSSDYLKTPWKNGLGFTEQIAIHPPGADLRKADFMWRLSSARIEKGAPFSLFPQHDRVLIILSGAGVKLTHTFEEGDEPETVEVGPLEPYEFPGDVPTQCELMAGPVSDLSVFFAKGLDVEVESTDLADGEDVEWPTSGATNFVFVARGQVEMDGERVTERQCLRVEAVGTDMNLRAVEGDAHIVLIQIGAGE